MNLNPLKIVFYIILILTSDTARSYELICSATYPGYSSITAKTSMKCTTGNKYSSSDNKKLHEILDEGWNIKTLSHDVFVLDESSHTSLIIIFNREEIKK